LAACGWNLEAAWHTDADGRPVWERVAWGSILLAPDTIVVDAELNGLEQIVAAIIAFAQHGHVLFDCYRVAA
jgi:hypothetical protein